MMKNIEAVIRGQKFTITFDENSIHIYNAYQIKEDLKLRGYRFDPENKTWFIEPSDIKKELGELSTGISGIESITQSPGRSLLKERAGTDLPESYSVIQLRNTIEKALNTSIPGKIWIRGVIASEVKNYKWFSYFDLKDEDEKLDIHFNIEARSSNIGKVTEKLKKSGVSEILEKELPVFILVNLKVSLKNKVDVRLELLDILPEYTRAKIKSKLDITIEKLKEERIYDLQKNLSLPKLIKNIALITSEQGTSIRDIMAGLHPNEKRFNIFFTDSRMEGANAIASIVGAISFLESHPSIKFDCIIIARGGGSEQSLGVFNEYEICRRVCLTKIPVITAIGHEKDLSAIELCSHITPVPSTPSGIGKFFSQGFKMHSDKLGELLGRIILSFSVVHKGETEKVNSHLSHIPVILGTIIKSLRERLIYRVKQVQDHVFYSLREIAGLQKSILDKYGDLMNTGSRLITGEEIKVNMYKNYAESNSPRRVLERGFTLTLDENGNPLTSLAGFRKAEHKKLRFFDGEIFVEEKENK